MNDQLNPTVQKIIGNYLNRMKSHLKGFPPEDQEELLKEIYSHIYESFLHDETEDEVERIFAVLNRLGDPQEVLASRVSKSMVGMGKKRKLPLYILAGIFIGLFGIPLGLGGLSMFFGLAVCLIAMVLCYFVAAFSFVVGGWGLLIASIIRLFYPNFLTDYIHGFEQFFPIRPERSSASQLLWH